MASFMVSRCWQLQRVDLTAGTSPPSVVGYRHYLAHGVGVQNVYTMVQCRRYLITGCWLVCLSSLSLDEGICVHIHWFVIVYMSSIWVQHQHLVCRLGMMWGHTIVLGKHCITTNWHFDPVNTSFSVCLYTSFSVFAGSSPWSFLLYSAMYAVYIHT